MYPSIFDSVYEYLVWDVEVDDEIDGFILLIKSFCKVVCLLCCTRVAILLRYT